MKIGKATYMSVAALSLMALAASNSHAGTVTWWTPNFNEARARGLVEKFQSAHPDIKVRLELTATDGLPQRVLTTLMSGAPPDAIDVQHGWVRGYAENKLVQSVDEVLSSRADYVPAALQYNTWNNRLWAIPYRVESLAVVFNKGHFRAAGLDPEKPPQTWSAFAEVAKKLTVNGKSGFAITAGGEFGNTVFRAMPFLWMAGGGILSDDGTKILVNSPESIKAVSFYTDFYKNGISPVSTLQNDGTANRQLFIAEKVSMYQAGQFDLASIRKENPKIDIGMMLMPAPDGGKPAAILGGWSLVVPSAAKNPADAKVLIGFLAQPENQAILTDTFPARFSAMEAVRFQDPSLKVFKQMLPFGRPVPSHPKWLQISQAFFDGVQRILLREQDAKTSMDTAAADIKSLMN